MPQTLVSQPGHRPCPAATEKAPEPPGELAGAGPFPAPSGGSGKLTIATEISENLEYSGNKIKMSFFSISIL